MGIFKFIFIAILVFYLFRLIARAILPFVLRKLTQKFEQDINQQYQRSKKEKDVYINTQVNRPKYEDNKVGEYVDYEEID